LFRKKNTFASSGDGASLIPVSRVNKNDMKPHIIVEIPSCSEHEGYSGNLIKVALPLKCECGGDRAVSISRGLSYDGSRRLNVDMWSNSCGCIDTYPIVRKWIVDGKAHRVHDDTMTTYQDRRINGEAQFEADYGS
jgi:hypothetical protein